MHTWIVDFWQLVRSIVLPDFCYVCRTCRNVKSGLCTVCKAAIMPVVSMPVVLSKTRTITVHAASTYDGPLKTLVLKKNYGVASASTVLGAMIYEHTVMPYKQFDVIVPVPLHWTRYAWRWFNQADIIADVLHKKTGIPVVKLVKRSNRTVFQAGLSKEDRTTNLRGAFSLSHDAQQYKGKKIVIVDDVYTTGTTIKEVSRLLYALEPESIDVVVACRVF